ncbi:MAG: hypothetical protein CVU00_05125 [Bacteroidetes bacterium HGW-Bacteroidetes-17]|nr:MAG: hypothetical protein CVU00_05125 [Bacteroidetes bacterium HGW-Bacteroidetes-17]
MKTKILATTLLLISFFAIKAYSQVNTDELFIYGKVTTIDGDQYVGQIRWGTEEVFWFDFFNATKPVNENLEFLSRSEMNDLRETSEHWAERWVERVFSVNDGSFNTFTHTFACQFGDLKSIEVRSRNRVNVILKDDQVIRLDDGSNDIGATIRILDEELGKVEVKWDRLDRVDFMVTPQNLRDKFGEPIFGKVQTRYGEITGYIQWDHDERLSVDKLDGETRRDNYSIPFENIQTIEKYGSGVLLKTKSGKELELEGSNDVNRENRGIIVNTLGMGRVDIPWSEFEKLSLSDPTKADLVGYNDFKGPNKLAGTVCLANGTSYSGLIVYDLDESIDIEMLNGEKDDIQYLLPFRTIQKISPKNYYYTQVTLKDGDMLLLGKTQDVSDQNTGILVFESDSKYHYVPWRDVEEIVFK